jgi:hypothetical protein
LDETGLPAALRVLVLMMTLHIPLLHGKRLSLVVFCFLLVLTPLEAQTGKELMADACYNELHQREQHFLWASQVRRRTAGHVYLEEEIETVEGPIRRLLSVDGHEPSQAERKQDDDRLLNLRHNPKARLTLKKDREADEKKFDDLLRVLPNAFLFEDQGEQEGSEKLAFRPNPAYKPMSYEERALHALSGVVLIDVREKRLVELSGTLTQQVEFGYGILGHLNKGGKVEVKRIRLSPDVWKTSSSRLELSGRFVFFKTISKQMDETHSDFKPVAPDTSIQQALDQTMGN